MVVNRKKLLDDISKVIPGISKGMSIIEDADTIVFRNGRLYSYNSSISVDVLDSNNMGLNCIIKGDELYNAVSKLSSDEIDIEVGDKKLTITENKKKFTLNFIINDNIFERFESLVSNEEWTDIDGEDFNNALKGCYLPNNKGRFSGLICKNSTILSTNSYVINKYVLKTDCVDFYIDNDSVAELIKWDNFTKISDNGKWLQFKSSDDTVFSVRKVDNENFDYDKILKIIDTAINSEFDFQSEFTSDVYKSIENASVFYNEEDEHKTVNFSIGESESKVYSERLSGSYEEIISSIKTDSDKEFNFKIDIDILKTCANLFSKFKLISIPNNNSQYKLLFENENFVKLTVSIE